MRCAEKGAQGLPAFCDELDDSAFRMSHVDVEYRYLVIKYDKCMWDRFFDVPLARWVRIAADNMLRNACAVLAGSALRGGGRTSSRAQQLQQLRCLNIHEYQVRRCPRSWMKVRRCCFTPN